MRTRRRARGFGNVGSTGPEECSLILVLLEQQSAISRMTADSPTTHISITGSERHSPSPHQITRTASITGLFSLRSSASISDIQVIDEGTSARKVFALFWESFNDQRRSSGLAFRRSTKCKSVRAGCR